MVSPFARYLQAAAAAAVVIVLLLVLWFGAGTVLLAFAGVLLAIALRSASDLVCRFGRMPQGWSLVVVVILIGTIVAAAVILGGAHVGDEIDQLQNDLPQAWRRAQENVRRFHWGAAMLDHLPGPDQLLSGGGMYGRALTAFSSTLSAVGSAIIIAFLGLYFAIDPGLYRTGVIRLLPSAYRDTARKVLDRTGDQLRRWLLGKLALMAFVFVATSIGLVALSVPLVVTLALLAAALDFVPNIGPVVAAIPALVLAAPNGVSHVIWVGALYLAVQIVESYILQPMVQQRAVSLPPSLTLLAQVLMATLFGILGVILATPIAVMAVTVVRTTYIDPAEGNSP